MIDCLKISRRLATTCCCLLAMTLISCGSPRQNWRGQLVEPQREVPPLTGVNWNGAPFSIDQIQGKVTVVFFGYTFCPDICPFTLAKLKQVAAQLGVTDEDLAVVFVSVDPHRDTVEKLSTYVPNFDPGFFGLHIKQTDLEQLQDDWNLTVQYGQPKDGPGTDTFYYVDHTGTYFIVDRAGQLRLTFPPNAKAEDLAADLAVLLEEKA